MSEERTAHPTRRSVSLLVAGLLLTFGWVSGVAGWVPWSVVGGWLAARAGSIAVLLVAVGLLGVAGWSWWRGAPVTARARPRVALSWWVVAAALFLVVVVSWAATGWLLHEATFAKDVAATRVDAIKTGLGIGAGTGGVFALLLAVRRQWHQELTAADTALDATERRVTELYTKAADQLGSDKAPVRLAGLYALERLAQANLTQRQTVVNVLCAYLRMPYQPPDPPPAEGKDALLPTSVAAVRAAEAVIEGEKRVQEREVRLTAQRILADHLRPGSDAHPVATFWANSTLDLTSALLIDFDMSDCQPHTALFVGARFVGHAWFAEARFAGEAEFSGASFAVEAWFAGASFAVDASFDGARFAGRAVFSRASFAGEAGFAGASFAVDASFDGARFAGHAVFSRASFAGPSLFVGARFAGQTVFVGTSFAGEGGAGAALHGARFGVDSGRTQRLPTGLGWAPASDGWRTAISVDSDDGAGTTPSGSAPVADGGSGSPPSR